MKLLIQAIVLSCALLAGSAQRLTNCGLAACVIPLNSISCLELLETYTFQGSCCSLEDIPATGGCRIRVAGAGNCVWTPNCEACLSTSSEECWVYETSTTDECPVLQYDYDAIAYQASMNSTASCSPTQAPVAPSAAPQDGSGAPSLSLVTFAAGLLVASLKTYF